MTEERKKRTVKCRMKKLNPEKKGRKEEREEERKRGRKREEERERKKERGRKKERKKKRAAGMTAMDRIMKKMKNTGENERTRDF